MHPLISVFVAFSSDEFYVCYHEISLRCHKSHLFFFLFLLFFTSHYGFIRKKNAQNNPAKHHIILSIFFLFLLLFFFVEVTIVLLERKNVKKNKKINKTQSHLFLFFSGDYGFITKKNVQNNPAANHREKHRINQKFHKDPFKEYLELTTRNVDDGAVLGGHPQVGRPGIEDHLEVLQGRAHSYPAVVLGLGRRGCRCIS